MIERSKSRSLWIAVLCTVMIATGGRPATAITLLQPGYTDNLVASLVPDNYYGSMALDGAGNIYLTRGYAGTVTKVTPGGSASTFLTVGGSTTLSLERVGNTMFVGSTAGQVYSVDLTSPTPAATLLGTTGGAINGLTYAPGSFGAYGGDLILATSSGLQSMDAVTGALTGFSRSGIYSDALFGAAGQLIATHSSLGVQEISDSGGLVASILSGSPIDGLAVSSVTGDIYATNGCSDTITRIDGSTYGSSSFASGANFDCGYYPTAIAFSNDGGSLYYYDSNGDHSAGLLKRIDGFPTSVPEPGMMVILGLGVAGLGIARRRSVARP